MPTIKPIICFLFIACSPSHRRLGYTFWRYNENSSFVDTFPLSPPRKSFDEKHMARLFVPSQMISAELRYVRFIDRRVLGPYDEGGWCLPPHCIAHAYHSRIDHVGLHSFDAVGHFFGEDVLASGDDHAVFSPPNAKMPFVVKKTHVLGVVPAVRKNLVRQGRVAAIALHHRRGANEHLAHDAGRAIATRFVHHPDVDPQHGLAHRIQKVWNRMVLRRQRRARCERLRHPIGLAKIAIQIGLAPFHEIDADVRRPVPH